MMTTQATDIPDIRAKKDSTFNYYDSLGAHKQTAPGAGSRQAMHLRSDDSTGSHFLMLSGMTCFSPFA